MRDIRYIGPIWLLPNCIQYAAIRSICKSFIQKALKMRLELALQQIPVLMIQKIYFMGREKSPKVRGKLLGKINIPSAKV